MTETPPAGPPDRRERAPLVPRMVGQGYRAEEIAERRRWLEQQAGCQLDHVGSFSLPGEQLRGNVENPIGVAQVPLGVAGPLHVRGQHADGIFYLPMATNEGALVRSYERGMVAVTRCGGVVTRLVRDENRVSPVFCFAGVEQVHDFIQRLGERFADVRAVAEATTRHGRLLRADPHPVGRKLILDFTFYTADAHGMNMIVRATEAACRWLQEHLDAPDYYIFSGHESEKRASGALLAGGKGKWVLAEARLPPQAVRAYLHTTPAGLVAMWQHTMIGHLQAGAIGYNGQYANGLTALFLACGQDVANVANSAVGITHFELEPDGESLYVSVTLPSLTVATVGGGTGLGTARECLQLLGCAGTGGAPKLAEIAAAMMLAGELSMGAAVAAGEMAGAHERYGRNRPQEARHEGD